MKIYSDIPSGVIRVDTRSLTVEGPAHFLLNPDQSVSFWTFGHFFKDRDKNRPHEMQASCNLTSGELYALSHDLNIAPQARQAFKLLLALVEGKEAS